MRSKAIFVLVVTLLSAAGAVAQTVLPDPTIHAFSSEFTGYDATYALDDNPDWDWATQGDGTDAYMDFDFGAPTRITRIDYTDRRTSGGANGTAWLGSSDDVTSFDLIFSTDSVFGNGDDIVQSVTSGACCVTDSVTINGGNGYLARYVRFDVTGTATVDANVGAAEFEFFTNTADLSITKTGPAEVTVGENITYTITVTNNGPAAASAVQVIDPIPAGTTFVSATPDQGSCVQGPPVDCDLGEILSGASVGIELVVTAQAEGNLQNVATVSNAPETDGTPGNDASAPAGTVVLAVTAEIPTASTLGLVLLFSALIAVAVFRLRT
jgi:uncharacterized repeat protein (TIGR01451 family)